MLRPETLVPRPRPRFMLVTMLALGSALGTSLLLEGGHPLPAVKATVTRWALEHPSPAVVQLLGVSRAEMAKLRAAAESGTATVRVVTRGRTLLVAIE